MTIICKMCYECSRQGKDCKGLPAVNPKLGKPCSRYEIENDDAALGDDEQPEAKPESGFVVDDRVDSGDVRHNNFVRLAAKRVATARDKIRLIGNLAGANYHSTLAERRSIVETLRKDIERIFNERD